MSIPALTLFSEPLPPTHTLTVHLRTRPPHLHEATHPSLQPCHPPRTVLLAPGLRDRAPAGAARGGGQEAGEPCALKVATNTACKLLGCSRPELSRSAEPSRRGCPGGSSPGGREEGTSRRCPRNPPAPAHRDTCPSLGDRSLPQCHPVTDGRNQLPRTVGRSCRCPGGDSGRRGRRPPSRWGGSLRGLQPLYLRRAALRTDQRGSAWRTGSAPARLNRGRVVSGVLGVVGGGRGEPRAGHSAD